MDTFTTIARTLWGEEEVAMNDLDTDLDTLFARKKTVLQKIRQCADELKGIDDTGRALDDEYRTAKAELAAQRDANVAAGRGLQVTIAELAAEEKRLHDTYASGAPAPERPERTDRSPVYADETAPASPGALV